MIESKKVGEMGFCEGSNYVNETVWKGAFCEAKTACGQTCGNCGKV
jgi:hypothetical protein